MKIAQKTIAITGAGNGIGRALALALLQKGARVAAIDISEEGLQQTEKEAGALTTQLSCHAMDITNKQQIPGLIEAILHRHGCIDGLINNAGVIQPFVTIKELEESDINRVMNINFFAVVYLIKGFLPHLLQRPEAHIVNISSMGGFLPVPGQSIYGASKAAVKLLTEGLRSELLNTGVRVTVVFPGAVDTEITKNSGVQPPKMSEKEFKKYKSLSADTAASIILRGMEKNAFRVLVGSDAKFMDFLYRLWPKMAANYIQRSMQSLLNR
jgi:short-subunit dehydrogenase